MNSARKRSDRYKILTGKMCGNCERPAAYIKEVKVDGRTYFECLEKKGGCSHQRLKPDEAEIEEIFDTPVEMQVFSWKGMVDTTFSPKDSIRYYKSFLQSGMLSIDPYGLCEGMGRWMNLQAFQYDHVGKAKDRSVRPSSRSFTQPRSARNGSLFVTSEPSHCVFDMPDGQPEQCVQRIQRPDMEVWSR